jgi:hypothetical protein
MTIPTGAGWTCAQCGVFVRHTCRTLPETPNSPAVYSIRPTRYHVRGTLFDSGVGGRKYAVDLIVEPIP